MSRWMLGISLLMTTLLAGPALHQAVGEPLLSTLDEAPSGAAGGESMGETEVTAEAKVTAAPAYCKPCLYCSGDFDPGDMNSNAQLNGNNRSSPAYMYTPFAIPTGHAWRVSGLIINVLNTSATGGIVDPSTAGWSIWQGQGLGISGTITAGGVAAASVTPTGRAAPNSFTEYTVIVKLKPAIKLAWGTYFMNVLPQCTNAANSKCT